MSYEQPPDNQSDVPSGPPPGWYPSPGDPQLLRWWDGRQWGPQTRPLPEYRQASQPQFGDASGGYDAFWQQNAGQYPRQSGTRQPPGMASGAYPASFPALQQQQPDPRQPQGPQDPYQSAGWAQQPAYAPGPQPQSQRAPRRARKQRARSVLIGLGTLVAIIVAISVATTHSSSSGNTAATAAAPSSAAGSAAAPPSCQDQAVSWKDNGGLSQFDAFETDLSAFQKADLAFVAALNSGSGLSAAESGVQSTAASLQSDTQAVEADLPPACITGMRVDLGAAMADYNKVAVDAQNAMDEFSSGSYDVATGDLQAATRAEDAGNVKLAAATSDLNKFENGNG
jgi:Protein of unknown function (DUF2510)